MTPVIRLFATRSKRHDFSLQFQGSQSDLWRLFSHPLHHKLRNYSRRFFCVIRAGEPELCSLRKPTLNEGHWAGLLSESATFATARRGRAAPATTGSRSARRPSVREAILKPAPPRHATTGANAKRRPPQPPTTGTLLKPRPPQPPTTGTFLKPRPPQRNQTRLKTWFHGQQGWRRFRPHQSQAQQGWPGFSYPYRQANQAAAAASLPPRSRQARSSQNGSTRSIQSEGGGEVPIINSMTEIAFLFTATSVSTLSRHARLSIVEQGKPPSASD